MCFTLAAVQLISKFKKSNSEDISRCAFCKITIGPGDTRSTKWFNGLLICEACSKLCPKYDNNMRHFINGNIVPSEIGDYAHQQYLTRALVSNFNHTPSVSLKKISHLPSDEYLYTLMINTSFFDIPSRAPRWATHSGQDYHGIFIFNLGTWLPQLVSWSIKRYTLENERILSNFAGRGTDAIECLLNGRK
jgi:DNA modification methylase